MEPYKLREKKSISILFSLKKKKRLGKMKQKLTSKKRKGRENEFILNLNPFLQISK